MLKYRINISLYPFILFTSLNIIAYKPLFFFFKRYLNFQIESIIFILEVFKCIIALIIRNYHKKQISYLNAFESTTFSIILITLFIISNTFEYYILLKKDNSFILYICALCIFSNLLIILIIHVHLTKQIKKEKEIAVKLEKIKYETLINNQFKYTELQLLKIKHDLKHFLLLLPTSDNTIKENIENSFKNINFYNTPCNTLNYVLYVKDKEMINKKISFTYSINLTKSIKMNSVDLCLIISNIFDNAINHIGNPREIHLTVKESINNCIIILQNTFSESDICKSNKKHGYGLKTIEDIAINNNGVVSFNKTSNIYTIKLLLPLDE